MSSTHPHPWSLIEEEELEHDEGIEQLLQDELHFTEAEARAEVKTQCGVHVSYTKLKRCYELLCNRCN